MVRTRIAPSPTGYLHIGTARTALFNYLYARKHGGQFVLRIEDTDKERSQNEFEQDIIDGLHWLGINWDEGPDCVGPYGPYRQSERIDIYTKYLTQLFEQDLLYPCYCTTKELEQERELQTLAKQPPRYSGKCRDLSDTERKVLQGQGRASTLRFKMPRKVVTITDLVRGAITFDTATLDDIIIAKNLDTPLYNVAVVIDDYLMKITHVIRGEDHISNTPKQILLGEALGLPAPHYGHLPLILNEDRTKLSKRQNKVSLLEYKKDGYLPEAIINFIALLGWSGADDRELFMLSDLEPEFDLSRVHKAGAVFNVAKLDWFNAHYIKQKAADELTRLCIPHLIEGGLIAQSEEGDRYTVLSTRRVLTVGDIESAVTLEQGRIKKLSDITEALRYVFVALPIYDAALLAWKQMTNDDVHRSLLFSEETLKEVPDDCYTQQHLETIMKDAIIRAEKKNGEVLWPLRVALTGRTASPSPFEVAAVLGKEQTLKRIVYARTSVDALSL